MHLIAILLSLPWHPLNRDFTRMISFFPQAGQDSHCSRNASKSKNARLQNPSGISISCPTDFYAASRQFCINSKQRGVTRATPRPKWYVRFQFSMPQKLSYLPTPF
jgi:hypothetical protein